MTEKPPKKHFFGVPNLKDASEEEINAWAKNLHSQILQQFKAEEEESPDSSSPDPSDNEA